MVDVVALGELLVDFIPHREFKSDNFVFEAKIGGAPANVLSTLAKWGKKTAYLGKVGNDMLGHYLSKKLREGGIDDQGLIVGDGLHTTMTFVTLDKKGERSFEFYREAGADRMLRTEEINFKLIEHAKIFHYGSISMTHEPAKTATFDALKYAKKKGLVCSYDPNLRPMLWDSLQQAKAMIMQGMTFADIVKISQEELDFLTGVEDVEKGIAALLSKVNIPLLFVTLGEKGSIFCFDNQMGYVPGIKVEVVDTTGAGDAYLAGVLYRFLELGKPLIQLSFGEVEQMARFANVSGALATTRKGGFGVVPTLPELARFDK